MCAIDTLGMAAMLEQHNLIESVDITTGQPVTMNSGRTIWDPQGRWCSSALTPVAARLRTAAATTSTSSPTASQTARSSLRLPRTEDESRLTAGFDTTAQRGFLFGSEDQRQCVEPDIRLCSSDYTHLPPVARPGDEASEDPVAVVHQVPALSTVVVEAYGG
jgi:hypothetical protein